MAYSRDDISIYIGRAIDYTTIKEGAQPRRMRAPFLAPLDLAGLCLLLLDLLRANPDRIVFNLLHLAAVGRIAVSERIDPIIKAQARSIHAVHVRRVRPWQIANTKHTEIVLAGFAMLPKLLNPASLLNHLCDDVKVAVCVADGSRQRR